MGRGYIDRGVGADLLADDPPPEYHAVILRAYLDWHLVTHGLVQWYHQPVLSTLPVRHLNHLLRYLHHLTMHSRVGRLIRN